MSSHDEKGWVFLGQTRLRGSSILLIGLSGMALIGVLIIQQFGEGVDEFRNYLIGWQFIHTYETVNPLSNPGINYYNGPFYMMIWAASSQALHAFIPAWKEIDGGHFTNLITFLVGLRLFYGLCQRFTSSGISLLATLLFATQPLMFGLGILDQKDTPFMVFFLASVVLGWDAVDRLTTKVSIRSHLDQLASDWRDLGLGRRWALLIGGILAGLFLLDLWSLGWMVKLAEHVVTDAYYGRSSSLIKALFARVATDAYKTPLELYIAKIDVGAFWLKFPISIGVLAVCWEVVRRSLPTWMNSTFGPWARAWGAVVLAGALVGAATSIRLAGPLAAMFVAGLLFVRLGRRGLVPIIVYGLVALTSLYV